MKINILDGDLFENGDPRTAGLPLEQFDYLRQTEPCARVEVNDPALLDWSWVLTRWEDVDRVARDAVNFPSSLGVTLRKFENVNPESGGKASMISVDKDDHRRHRGVFSKAFTPKVINAFEERLRTLTEDMVEKALDLREFDFVAEISAMVPLHALCDLLGVPDEDRGQLLSWSNAISVPTDPDYAPTPEESMAAVNAIWDYGLRLVKLRADQPADDLFTQVAIARHGDLLSDDELMGNTLLLATAGNETTRNALSHGLNSLLHNPDQMANLRESVAAGGVPPEAVDEILRFSSPIAYQCRRALHDTEIAGTQVKAGDPIALHWAAANFDPEKFDDPHKFDVRRTSNTHIALGRGPHACIGAHVARMEIRLTLEELLRRTKDISFNGSATYARDAYLHGVKNFPISVVPA